MNSTTRNEKVLDMISRCRDTAENLLSRSQDFNETIPPRRWKGQELASLIGVKNIQNLYVMEKSGKLPEGYKDERNDNGGYTLEMALEAMKVNGTLPWRSTSEPAAVLSFTNFKGGCWKTSTAWHFGSWAASVGFRVLMVDVDPQASLTRNLGFKPDIDIGLENTLADVLSGGEEATYESIRRRILRTHIFTLDLIPASLDLQAVEWLLAAKLYSVGRDASLTENDRITAHAGFFLRLAFALDTVANDYDLIVLDGTPTLGILPLNIVFASHGLIVPVPAEKLDFASTKSFLDLLEEHLHQLAERFGDRVDLPEPWFLVTKFDSGQSTTESEVILDKFIKPTFEDRLLETVIHSHKKAVSVGSYFSRTMFDVSSTTLAVRSEARIRCMENFERAGQEIMEKVVYPYWPERAHMEQLKKEIDDGY